MFYTIVQEGQGVFCPDARLVTDDAGRRLDCVWECSCYLGIGDRYVVKSFRFAEERGWTYSGESVAPHRYCWGGDN